ncbi:MAG: hypothetical protein WDW38_008254 [Sanguina aurantia]
MSAIDALAIGLQPEDAAPGSTMPTSTPAADGSSALTSSSAPSTTLDICQAEHPIPQPSPSPPPPSAAATSTHSSMPSLPTRPPKKPAAPAASPTTASQPIQANSPPTAAASMPSTSSSSNSQTSQNGPSLPQRTSPAATTSRASPAQASGVSGQSPKPVSSSASAAAAAAAAGTSSASTASTAAAPKGMPALPRRTPPPAVEAESEEVLRIRAQIHDIRVILVRAALRLGYSHESAIVMQVLYRLNLAENIKEPSRKVSGKRIDRVQIAAQEAASLEQATPGSTLKLTLKILVLGLEGSGKTQLCYSLLGRPDIVDGFDGGTTKMQLLRGTVHGIDLMLYDSPGLTCSASDTSHGMSVLRQIKRAYRSHKPDLVLYVDRLDAPHRGGAELQALRSLSHMLGPAVWLNTIVAFTHAGTQPPMGSRGPIPFDQWAGQRSHVLQELIRMASGDSRLMNPVAYAESHPICRRNPAGQSLIASGMPWQSHLYLMLVAAKLLADSETTLQMSGSASAPSLAQQQAQQAMMMGMGGPKQMPVPYLMQQLVQQSQPLTYPDHENVIELRKAKASLPRIRDLYQRRALHCKIKGSLLQLRQIQKQQAKQNQLHKDASLAGGKVTPEPPTWPPKADPALRPSLDTGASSLL